MRKVIETKFNIGDTVYLKTDVEQMPRIITAIIVNPYDILYRLNSGAHMSDHYDLEISNEKIIF